MCRKPLGHGGPLFWRLSAERHGLDRRAIQSVAGLEMHLGGNAALANVFAGDPEISTRIGEKVEFLICETCAFGGDLPVGMVALQVMEDASDNACTHPGCTQTDGKPCDYAQCPQRGDQP